MWRCVWCYPAQAAPTSHLQTFIIPCLAFNIHYQLKQASGQNRLQSSKPPVNNR
jgi:hypothetical protein